MNFLIKWLFFMLLGFCEAWLDDRPLLESRDGHLYISSAKDKNVTLKVLGSGYINVNDINLLHVAVAAQNATRLVERWRRGYLSDIENTLQRLTEVIEGPQGLQRKVNTLISNGDFIGNINSSQSATGGQTVYGNVSNASLNQLKNRVRRLETRVRRIFNTLRRNECLSNPCQNGGTCIDLYDGFQCYCTAGWEGPVCTTDVNECATYAGTDLGCQNGATCINTVGSYKCNCASGWYGFHCVKKSFACNTENSAELCGHGVCVNRPGSAFGYTCICDQGWEALDSSNPSCLKDIDECALNHPPCSVNPPVSCHNRPGTFFCGNCPQGFSGNGYYCVDIDECAVDNGGCSMVPKVQCRNTMGSRVCGNCPPGYQGDGITCSYVGICRINNGGCHPLATCVDNAGTSNNYVLCTCPQGYTGPGVGPHGCVLDTSASTRPTNCDRTNCIHGVCVGNEGSLNGTCVCHPNYSGPRCDVLSNPCEPNPCQNGGVCIVSRDRTLCRCTATYTGLTCATPRLSCGGVFTDLSGTVEFPVGGAKYQHGLSCSWLIATNHSMVLNITFTKFELEPASDCRYDFLQIYDGRTAGSHMIGRFCGNTLPMNGTIISSHNAMYFWFHSDSSISHDGFAFNWTSIEPVCGGEINADHGTVSSPGSPGMYPANRDCYWDINVSPGKRIQFHFYTLMLEEHLTCDYDYLMITETVNSVEHSIGLYCNHTLPPPVTTSGRHARVHFHSDNSGQDSGFQLVFSSVAGSPDCGGTYTAVSGEIFSPGFHDSGYQSLLNCEWLIRVPRNERISLTWLDFHLEDNVECSYDYVNLYDGDSPDSPLIARYCGDTLPGPTISSYNTLLIKFETDVNSVYQGFRLKYDTYCGGEFTELSGILTSPNFPNEYPGSKECIYRIALPRGYIVQFTIEFMDMEPTSSDECLFDYLEIYNGNNENSTRLAKLCSTNDTMPSSPFFSTHNYMFLKFVTDGSIHRPGFKANYTAIEQECGGMFTEPTGTLQWPANEDTYKSDQTCTWIISAPSTSVIQISWTSFSVELKNKCSYDYVAVYDNYNLPNQQLINKYCGSTKPPTITSQGQVLGIVFHSDRSVEAGGFSMNYMFMNTSQLCGAHYYTPTGVVRSPNYPDRYPYSKECEWVIHAPNRHIIVLKKKVFQLESHRRCKFDYLEIRNGGFDSSPLLGRFCGFTIPEEIISTSNLLYLKFVSDDSKSADGFELEWDSTTAGCGGTLTESTGDIISPNYPQPYDNNADCTWKIAVAAGSVVQIIFIDFELEVNAPCRFEFLEISDGFGRTTNVNRYCNSEPDSVLTMKSNLVTVRFRSDASDSGRGFHIRYKTVCNNALSGFEGVIESPNFPHEYSDNINCTWIINAPVGNKVNITFSHFELEQHTQSCNTDYLEIKEGEDSIPNTQLGKFCGNQKPPKVSSTQHQVFVNFITDSSITFGGFRMEWIIVGCILRLTRPSDTFTSPNYPKPYTHNVECQWYIEVDLFHSIVLTFDEIDTEKSGNCIFDSIEIYNGGDEHAPHLARLCYSKKPVTLTSSSNKLFVVFKSDASYVSKGFSARYESVPLKCGGVFTAASGSIHTTNYPMNYDKNQYCEWLITVDDHHVVNLTFTDFDIENTKNCTDDYVKIYDGPTTASPELGTHCHNVLPPSYKSTGNQMLVVMRSDNFITAKGFMATYERACGARITVNGQGYIESPSSSMQSERMNCSWTLIAEDPGDHITLTFYHMEFGDPAETCENSFMQVHEGRDISGPVLGTWCSSQAPLPITSTGDALTINMIYRMMHEPLFGIAYTSLNTACGGNYTMENGTITSPNYPGSYPVNAECVWVLNVAPGGQILLEFSEFEIETNDYCNTDYLEVRQGDGAGHLVGIYCGDSIDTLLVTGTAWMKFRSNEVGTAKGFKAEYSLSRNVELSGPIGTIASPLYPRKYVRSGEFQWRVTVEIGYIIRIQFEDFHLENEYEFEYAKLTIYDGYDTEAPELLQKSGIIQPDSVQSSSNVVYIVFTCQSSYMGQWFRLSWLQVAKEDVDSNAYVTTLTNCDEIISLNGKNSSININSPGYPEGYEPNLKCHWVITSPPGSHVALRFFRVDLEESTSCISDYVSVYSGDALTSESTATLLNKSCLSNTTHDPIHAGNVMTVVFVSDVYLNKTGFKALAYKDCGGTLEGPSGEIMWDNNTDVRAYRLYNYNCDWKVSVRPGKTILVEVTDMDINNTDSTFCSRNYLILKNGESESSPFLNSGKFCGSNPPAPMKTTSNHLFVRFVGVGVAKVSFTIKYTEVGMNCGGTYLMSKTRKEQKISSPNYPNIPPPFSECFWTFIAPPGVRLSLHFTNRFDLAYSRDCETEFVEVRDGGTDISRSLGRFCKDTPPGTLFSTGNVLYIHYYTSLADPKNGFSATAVAGEMCGGTLRGTFGVIHSPNYPSVYPTNLNCTWWIVGPPDHALKIQFRDLDLPRRTNSCLAGDYVTVHEIAPRNDTDGALSKSDLDSETPVNKIGTFCGQEKPDVFDLSYNEAQITFHSDNRNQRNYKGFSLNFSASIEMCGGPLSGMSGEFKSFGYPYGAGRRFCEWRIAVPEGFHVAVTLLDIDGNDAANFARYYISFYNDYRAHSRIRVISSRSTAERNSIYSSSNLMLVHYWSTKGHRGLRARFQAIAPAPCGGSVSSVNGSLSVPTRRPFNETTFYCQWSMHAPSDMATSENDTGVTLTVKVVGWVDPNPHSHHCAHFYKVISVSDRENRVGALCGNYSIEPAYIRSPSPYNVIKIINGTHSKPMNFKLSFQWQQCGGYITGPTTISTPKNIPIPRSCAWKVVFPDNAAQIELTFSKMNMGPCDKNYLIVRNGDSFAPELGKFCGNLIGESVTASGNKVWIEYYATQEPAEFEFSLEENSNGCGSSLQGSNKVISSPGFSISEYPNNAECSWELVAKPGYHIGLVFTDRFRLEQSPDCKNDFIQIFDYDSTFRNNTWREIGKVCGSETPKPFNSTSNRMKVLFRTNENIQADGFRARWYQNCGGIFHVTKTPQYMSSPEYPKFYGRNLNCNYTFLGNGSEIILEFLDFKIEMGREECRFDNVTLITKTPYSEDMTSEVKCGDVIPDIVRSENVAYVILKTDRYVQRQGFQIRYHLSECGGIVTEPTTLEPLSKNDIYYENINCTWIVEAPESKSVVLRFNKFVLEHSTRCYFDHVAVYEGSFVNDTNLIGTFCGNLTHHLPSIRSRTNKMTVMFWSDSSRTFEGFAANVLFVKNEDDGCGGEFEVSERRTFKTQKGSTYDAMHDCHWMLKTSPGRILKFSFSSVDLRNASEEISANRSSSCTGDYLEIRDGAGPYGELIGIYCGTNKPGPVWSSTNFMYIRLFTDGTIEGSGVTGSVESLEAPCGLYIRNVTNGTQILMSPNYPNGNPTEITCNWILQSDEFKFPQITFKDLDVQESEKCTNGSLQISGRHNRENSPEGFGKNLIIASTNKERHVTIDMGVMVPFTTITYCGTMSNHVFYGSSKDVLVTFKSGPPGTKTYRGFKAEYQITSCNRNYTGPYGRIRNVNFHDCWFTITAPANHTISLYFNSLSLYDYECTTSGLKVYDGDFSGSPVESYCHASQPVPVFSTGNKLSVHAFSPEERSFEGYDMLYTTTDKGRGCGGTIVEYGGYIMSPLYPQPLRNKTSCTWDVSVPFGHRIAFEFKIFDIGSKNLCGTDHFKVYELSSIGDMELKTTYCGEDVPAIFYSATNRIFIEYETSLNNGGTGWVLCFIAWDGDRTLEKSFFPQYERTRPRIL